MQSRNIAIIVMISIGSLFAACKKKDEGKPNLNVTRHNLYNQYKNGEIDECIYNGDTVYCAGQSMYDAGATLYDASGRQIGECNYAWGPVDPICKQVNNCTVIYRCKNHITQLPFVDVYGLSK
jgi:hypothetical protein